MRVNSHALDDDGNLIKESTYLIKFIGVSYDDFNDQILDVEDDDRELFM
jgi:hypothetical protein